MLPQKWASDNVTFHCSQGTLIGACLSWLSGHNISSWINTKRLDKYVIFIHTVEILIPWFPFLECLKSVLFGNVPFSRNNLLFERCPPQISNRGLGARERMANWMTFNCTNFCNQWDQIALFWMYFFVEFLNFWTLRVSHKITIYLGYYKTNQKLAPWLAPSF